MLDIANGSNLIYMEKNLRLWIYMVLMLQPVKNAALALGTDASFLRRSHDIFKRELNDY